MSEVYTWEPSNEAIAARYGLPVERIVRFDTNTSPLAARLRAAVLAGARGRSTSTPIAPTRR